LDTLRAADVSSKVREGLKLAMVTWEGAEQ